MSAPVGPGWRRVIWTRFFRSSGHYDRTSRILYFIPNLDGTSVVFDHNFYLDGTSRILCFMPNLDRTCGVLDFNSYLDGTRLRVLLGLPVPLAAFHGHKILA
jgi:hypothetical protein